MIVIFAIMNQIYRIILYFPVLGPKWTMIPIKVETLTGRWRIPDKKMQRAFYVRKVTHFHVIVLHKYLVLWIWIYNESIWQFVFYIIHIDINLQR